MARTMPPHMTPSGESVLFADVNQMSSYEHDQKYWEADKAFHYKQNGYRGLFQGLLIYAIYQKTAYILLRAIWIIGEWWGGWGSFQKISKKSCPTLVAYWVLSGWLPCDLEVPPCKVCHTPITEGGLNLINSLGIPLGRACASSLSVNQRTNCRLDLAFFQQCSFLNLEVWKPCCPKYSWKSLKGAFSFLI